MFDIIVSCNCVNFEDDGITGRLAMEIKCHLIKNEIDGITTDKAFVPEERINRALSTFVISNASEETIETVTEYIEWNYPAKDIGNIVFYTTENEQHYLNIYITQLPQALPKGLSV